MSEDDKDDNPTDYRDHYEEGGWPIFGEKGVSGGGPVAPQREKYHSKENELPSLLILVAVMFISHLYPDCVLWKAIDWKHLGLGFLIGLLFAALIGATGAWVHPLRLLFLVWRGIRSLLKKSGVWKAILPAAFWLKTPAKIFGAILLLVACLTLVAGAIWLVWWIMFGIIFVLGFFSFGLPGVVHETDQMNVSLFNWLVSYLTVAAIASVVALTMRFKELHKRHSRIFTSLILLAVSSLVPSFVCWFNLVSSLPLQIAIWLISFLAPLIVFLQYWRKTSRLSS